jgi:hypothetical protein
MTLFPVGSLSLYTKPTRRLVATLITGYFVRSVIAAVAVRISVRYITLNTTTTIRLFVNSDETFRMFEVYT